MFPAHGDVKLPIIAAGTVEECFYGAVKALQWAEKYQGPVILMTEMSLAERSQNIRRPNLNKVEEAKRVTYNGTNGYLRYAGNELSPMPVPGNPGAYVANGSEYEADQQEHSIAVLPWGGSKGPAQEAYDQLKASGLPVGWYYTMNLNPLPPKMLEELKQKDLVIVPELNYQGQFSSILRSMGVKAESITQYTGLPFKARTLVERITEMTNARLKEAVKA
jgi:2-oxoglutarate ferredoxin oxidoreductase subunit alpha